MSSASSRHHRIVDLMLCGRGVEAEALADPDLGGFEEWADRHRLAPLLHDLASPGPLKTALRKARLAGVLEWEVVDAEILHFLNVASARGVPIIAFKGWGLARMGIYPDPALRRLGDVDLLVRPRDLDLALEVAIECGFDRCRSWAEDPAVANYFRSENHQVPLTRPDEAFALELHYGLYRPMTAEFEARILERAEPLTGAPGAFMLTLPDLFAVLCVHFAMGVGPALWIWVLDLVLLSRRLNDAAWIALRGEAVESGLQVHLYSALRACSALWPLASQELDGWSESLEPHLSIWERKAADSFGRGLIQERLGGDSLQTARVLSRRPLRGRHGAWSSLVLHPGAVALESRVSSTSPGFALYRARHTFARLTRLGRAMWTLLRR